MSEREEELSMRENAVGDREEAARRATEDAQGVRKEIERWPAVSTCLAATLTLILQLCLCLTAVPYGCGSDGHDMDTTWTPYEHPCLQQPVP